MLSERGSAWSQALLKRHSRRAYDGVAASPETLDALARVCRGFLPFADARVVLVRTPTVDIFTGAVGSYGKVVGSPHILALIADETSPASALHLGYTGEAAVLEATAQGLDTCWVAGFFDRSVAAQLLDLAPGERIAAVSPVGHAVVKRSSTEHTMSALARSKQRKPLRAIAKGADLDWPQWALGAVEAARVAPSAMNRQPWRFRLENGSLVLSMDSNRQIPVVRRELDCGIAMLHAELAARAHGAVGRWVESREGLDLARFTPEADASAPAQTRA